MKNQQELFELFMHNNMLPEPFDPDKVLAAAREAVPDYQPSEQFTKGMDKLLQKSKRRARKDSVKRFFSRRGVPQVAVASLVIVCCLVAVQASNGLLFDFLFQTHQTHTGVELTEQVREELLVDKLEEIDMQVYFPKYVPEGYSIADIEVSNKKIKFELHNNDSYILIYQNILNSYNAKFQLDSENADIEEEIQVNGEKAYYILKNGESSLFFFDNNNYYVIINNSLPKKEIIRIAESFEMVV